LDFVKILWGRRSLSQGSVAIGTNTRGERGRSLGVDGVDRLVGQRAVNTEGSSTCATGKEWSYARRKKWARGKSRLIAGEIQSDYLGKKREARESNHTKKYDW